MLSEFKTRWEIKHNWQFLPLVLGLGVAGVMAYYVTSTLFISLFAHLPYKNIWLWVSCIAVFVLILKTTLWCFKKLEGKWQVTYRWEFIPIFIVFAVTGSLSAKVAGPIMTLMGLTKDNTPLWLFWPLRILCILPLYQVLLLIFGFLFGQFRFFWEFERKMFRRMGFKF